MTPPIPGEAPAHLMLVTSFTTRDLPRLRLLIDHVAAQAGLPELIRGEFLTAIDAVATTAIEHRNGGTLRLQRSHGRLECHIEEGAPAHDAENSPSRGRGRGGSLWECGRALAERLSIAVSAQGATVALSVSLSLQHNRDRPDRR